jgi:hypothetical protein
MTSEARNKGAGFAEFLRFILNRVSVLRIIFFVENRTAAAVMALETYRSGVPAPETKPAHAWAAITGFITTQLCALSSDSCKFYDEIARLAG